MMSSRTLYLHIGPNKTGTSAIQFTAARGAGLYYPRAGRWADDAHHHIGMAGLGIERRGAVAIAPIAELKKALAEEFSGSRENVLISTESLPPGKVRTFIDQYSDLFDRHFDRLELVATIRSPLDRAASDYNQRVKDPLVGEKRHPDDYLDAATNTVRPMLLVKGLAATGYDVTYVSYHPAETLVPRFFTMLGGQAPTQADVRNRSMGGKALVTLLAANNLLTTGEARAAFFNDLRAVKGYGIWKGNGFPFSRRACAQFIERIADDVAALEVATGIDLRRSQDAVPERFALSDEDLADIGDRIGRIGYASEEQRRHVEGLIGTFRRQDTTVQS